VTSLTSIIASHSPHLPNQPPRCEVEVSGSEAPATRPAPRPRQGPQNRPVRAKIAPVPVRRSAAAARWCGCPSDGALDYRWAPMSHEVILWDLPRPSQVRATQNTIGLVLLATMLALATLAVLASYSTKQFSYEVIPAAAVAEVGGYSVHHKDDAAPAWMNTPRAVCPGRFHNGAPICLTFDSGAMPRAT
jgi:hypothetical protein